MLNGHHLQLAAINKHTLEGSWCH